MPQCLLCLFVLLFIAGQVLAQDVDYYPFAEREEPSAPLLTDTTLFYRAIQSGDDLYSRFADFNLPQVALARRGQSFRAERVDFAGLDLSYRYFTALRGLGAEERCHAGLAPMCGAVGSTGGVRAFAITDSEPLRPYSASVRMAGRGYLWGAKVAASGRWGRGWSYAAFADLRSGRDLQAEGVFTNALTVALRLARRVGAQGEVALLLAVPPSMRGTRLSSTEEAFVLTGDRLYNPAWGFQDGKVRNSRVRREVIPVVVASYSGRTAPATRLDVALSGEVGVSRYSMLGWYNARTPMPDNYRYLPSFTGDRETELVWRGDDARYTQIDWDGMIRRNRMAGAHALYALEDRVARACRLQFHATFTTTLSPALELNYGLDVRYDGTRNYKQMRDLLGADHIVDIDQFLVDDDTYGNLLQNDLRHPDRTIRRGDRFGYDYNLSQFDYDVHFAASYRADRLRADASVRVGSAVVTRRGGMEKELFAGAQSLGRSRPLRFSPYSAKATVGYAFSPRNYLEVVVMAGAEPPEASTLFCQPQYNNRIVDNPVVEQFYAAELNYHFASQVAELQCTAFATTTREGIAARRYFDDVSGLFALLQARGIATLSLGLEVAAEFRLSYRWKLYVVASAGRYAYAQNPRITILADVDNLPIDSHAESFLGGIQLGGAPQFTASGGVNYFGPKGWGFRFSVGCAGGRYVTPDPLRRTERIARQGGVTEEAFAAFTHQERLRDAFTADVSLFKTFYFDRSRLTASLSVRNLTAGRDVVSEGFESSRVRLLRAGDVSFRAPHASRYNNAYPRSFYLTISYSF